MKLFYSDQYVLPLPAGHTFPMAKYQLLRKRVAVSGMVGVEDLTAPPAATTWQLELAHDADYIQRAVDGAFSPGEVARIGFPWSPELVERSRRSCGATIEACRAAIRDGAAVNLAGGTHHAFRDHGEGYCLFNDTIVAARALQHDRLVRRVAVIDLDVHQGNGTAAICQQDDSIFTFSMHGAKNYPLRKEQSDLDIELEDRTGDTIYLDRLADALEVVFSRAMPDFIFYLAGADPYEGDRLGRLALTKAGLSERDRLVFDVVRRRGLPIVVTMAGGYGRIVEDTVDIHWGTVRRLLTEFGSVRGVDSPAANPDL